MKMAGYTLRPRSRSRLVTSFVLVAVVSFAATPKALSKVSAVRFWSLGELTRVAIDVSDGFKYRSERLTNPDRLFFDIEGARPDIVAKGLHTIQVGDGVVKQIRIAETHPGVTRIVLDLAPHVEFTASQLTSPDRLMIELHGPTDSKPRTAPVVGKVTEVVAPPSVTHPIDKQDKHPLDADKHLQDDADRHLPDFVAAPAAAAAKPEPRKFEPPPHTEPAPADAVAETLLSPPAIPVLAKLTKPPATSLSVAKSELPPPPAAATPAPPEPRVIRK